jgi:hypothetical protein
MFTSIIAYILNKESKIPEEYLKMIRAEYRSVPEDYVEYFLETNNRLPTPQELLNAI